jgi:hypothetical protein
MRSAVLSPGVVGAAGVVLATMVAYVITLAPDLYSLDSPELSSAGYRLGIAHPPGYPLYTLVAWLFSHAFLVSNAAYRLNLLSAIFAAACCALTYALALRITRRPAIAAAGALALGFSYYFWLDSLAAEVYTLDAALFAGILLSAYLWRERPTAIRAAVVGLTVGLACATRTTSLLYLPALALFAWIAGERSPRAYMAAAGGLAAGLAFYLYLPLRSAAGVNVGPGDYTSDGALHVWNLASVGGFFRHVSATAFRDDAFAYGPADLVRETGTFLARLAGSFLVVGIPLGIAGIVRQWRRDRALVLLIGGTALPVTLFFIDYGAVDKEFMFLPAYVAWALWIVSGLDWAAEALVSAGLATSVTAAAVAFILPILAVAVNARLVSLHDEHSVRDDSEAFLSNVPQGAIVYGSFLKVAPLQYLQDVEGQRHDVRLVNAWTVKDGFLLELARANAGVRPLYVMQEEPALRGQYQQDCVAGRGCEVRPRS